MRKDAVNSTDKDLELERFALVAKNTSNGVIITDKFGQIEWVNEAFTKVTGYTLEEVRGKRPSSFLHGKGTDKVVEQDINNLVEAKIAFSREVLNYKKDGSTFWVQVNISPVEIDGAIEKFVTIQTDITLIKEQQDKIRNQNERLRNIAFKSSHLIRAPLSNILGLISLLDNPSASSLSNEELVRYLRQSAEQLDLVVREVVSQAFTFTEE